MIIIACIHCNYTQRCVTRSSIQHLHSVPTAPRSLRGKGDPISCHKIYIQLKLTNLVIISYRMVLQARFYRDFDPMQPRGISYYPSALVDYLEVNVGEEWGRVCANQGTVTSNHGRLICRQFTKKFLTAIESRNLPLSVDIPR